MYVTGVRTALHVLLFFPRGGSAQVVRYLARALEDPEVGWHVRVLAGSLGGPWEPGNAATFFAGVDDLVSVPYDAAVAAPDPLLASPPFHPSYEDRPGAPDRVFASVDGVTYRHLVREWERILAAPGVLDGVGVAHMHHLTPAHEALARVAPGLPVVTHLHGTETLMLEAIVEGAGWRHADAWVARMRRWAARSAGVLASTPASAEVAARLLDLDPRRIEVVPNGIDPRVFSGGPAGPDERARRWRRWLVEDPRGWSPERPRPGGVRYTVEEIAPLLDPEATTAVFVGRFTAVKRAALLVRAHARARAALGGPLPLVFLGGAPGEWEGEHPAHAIARSPWGREVFLAGWRGHEDLPSALACSDLLAVPSVAERFGQVYLEGMAMGIPPIACDAAGPPSFVVADRRSPRRNGWLVVPDDEADLARALADAASDPAERRLRGENGRLLVAERFAWPTLARRVAAVYEAVSPTRAAGARRARRERLGPAEAARRRPRAGD
jgi:glycosyltransferase involved in cell wall biosynthesis